MLLSIIIVNYNVKFFLEQCLCSVEKALGAMDAEVFVVDNHSTDGSAEWLPGRFPRVRWILNSENKGFGAANNQALALAKGKYILFLNPDTLLAEDTLTTCISFMEADARAGAAGVRMIDGGGRFLKESRRGHPSPWVAFCKLAGLAALFPRSSLFAGYYLGHLTEAGNHPAPILSGACMIVRKEALDKMGGFDERFFLYAEDIDLSHRIEQAGYVNYYIADTTVIHFKGESTFRDTRYIKLFYRAMSQYRRKHFGNRFSRVFNNALEGVLWLRIGVSTLARFTSVRVFGMPVDTGEPIRSSGTIKVWVAGDEAEAVRVRARHLSGKREFCSGPGDADEIILCEGADFSFKMIIGLLKSGGKVRVEAGDRAQWWEGATYLIHAAGSFSAVGSPSSKKRGDAVILL